MRKLLPVNVKVPKKFAIWMPDQDFTESSVHCGSCAKTEPNPIDIKQNNKSNTAKPNKRSTLWQENRRLKNYSSDPR